MLSEAIINCSSCRNFLSPSPLVPLELSIIYRRSKRHHRLYSLGDHLSVVFALHKQHNNTSSCKTPSDTRVILHAWLCNLLHFAFYGLWLRWSFVLPFDECKKRQRASRDWATFGGLSTFAACAVEYHVILTLFCVNCFAHLEEWRVYEEINISAYLADWALQVGHTINSRKWQQTVKVCLRNISMYSIIYFRIVLRTAHNFASLLLSVL